MVPYWFLFVVVGVALVPVYLAFTSLVRQNTRLTQQNQLLWQNYWLVVQEYKQQQVRVTVSNGQPTSYHRQLPDEDDEQLLEGLKEGLL